MHIVVRVTPGARADRVGGRYGDTEQLLVRVRARAVDGRANTAVVAVVAAALGVARSQLRLVGGMTSRTKVLDVDVDVTDRLAELLDR